MNTELANAVIPAACEQAGLLVQHLANLQVDTRHCTKKYGKKVLFPVADIFAFYPQADHCEYGGWKANQAHMAKVVKVQVG